MKFELIKKTKINLIKKQNYDNIVNKHFFVLLIFMRNFSLNVK